LSTTDINSAYSSFREREFTFFGTIKSESNVSAVKLKLNASPMKLHELILDMFRVFGENLPEIG
jgi:hypothetical protein